MLCSCQVGQFGKFGHGHEKEYGTEYPVLIGGSVLGILSDVCRVWLAAGVRSVLKVSFTTCVDVCVVSTPWRRTVLKRPEMI